jgi:hypothetical protein
MAIIAITTSNSIRVKPPLGFEFDFIFLRLSLDHASLYDAVVFGVVLPLPSPKASPAWQDSAGVFVPVFQHAQVVAKLLPTGQACPRYLHRAQERGVPLVSPRVGLVIERTEQQIRVAVAVDVPAGDPAPAALLVP